MVNRDPRSFSTTRACWHVAHNPAKAESRFQTYQISGFPNFPIIMNLMFTSDAITRGIKVHVESEYAPERSQPTQNAWFFLYTITITNEGTEATQLMTRHWIITDATGRVEEVRGDGVVGKQPLLAPGESFTYTSGCPLTTPFGVMEGSYQMVTAAGEHFDARIAPFTLSEPYTVH
jgi:ApaG protein